MNYLAARAHVACSAKLSQETKVKECGLTHCELDWYSHKPGHDTSATNFEACRSTHSFHRTKAIRLGKHMQSYWWTDNV